jgi:ABC-type multidrug transport system ATPase subunit
VGGYPKVQETFARISGYVEQNDIHSPQLTVLESLRFSAWLRLSEEIDKDTRNVGSLEPLSLTFLFRLSLEH